MPLRLAKIRVGFLSALFYPIFSTPDRWKYVQRHVPPTTFSGMMLRALLFASEPLNLYGDYLPCRIGEGRLVKIQGDLRLKATWTVARRSEAVEGFKPPYLEYRFNAVSLGAYFVSMLMGRDPPVGVVEKYWNVIKYIDKEGLMAPIEVGLKTWFYTVMDGVRDKVTNKHYNTYEVVEVTHIVPLEEAYGFLLVDDEVADLLSKLRNGWFIDKSRLKTVVAVRLEDVLDPVDSVAGNVDYVVPMLRRPANPKSLFTTTVLDTEALRGGRRDRSVIKTFLYLVEPAQVDLEKVLLFRDSSGKTYAVDAEWLKYLSGGGAG